MSRKIEAMHTTLALRDLDGLARMSDDEVAAVQTDYADARHRVDAGLALIAAEVARRSARELGHGGLAQRLGDRTPEKFVQRTVGVTASEARAIVEAGEVTATPWLAAVSVDEVGVAAAAAIRAGLGEPTAEIVAGDLAHAADRLVALASTSTPEDLRAAARAERDALDEAGVAEREQRLRDERSLRYGKTPEGAFWLRGVLDPENGAVVIGALDELTAPRRGGPRFVDPDARAAAEHSLADGRTLDQATADALVDLVRLARGADAGEVFRTKRPAVTVHVQQSDLLAGTGSAWIEGTTARVSIETAQRIACSEGSQELLFDSDGQPLTWGRERRTFSLAQRRALAARDGGCIVAGCSMPPSMTEAHHCDEYERDQGRTDVADGVLLCRFHHMWLHANRLRIRRRRDGTYEVISRDPLGASPKVELRSKNPVASVVAIACR